MSRQPTQERLQMELRWANHWRRQAIMLSLIPGRDAKIEKWTKAAAKIRAQALLLGIQLKE